MRGERELGVNGKEMAKLFRLNKPPVVFDGGTGQEIVKECKHPEHPGFHKIFCFM